MLLYRNGQQVQYKFPHIDLPINEIVPAIRQVLETRQTLIVSATPGAGKSTLLPLMLLHEPWLDGKKVILLEPRRLAAMTIARRMADLLGEELGQTVGYRIRFDKKVGVTTRIEVVTEGILSRMLHDDNALEEVGLVIFDEFHERRIHADVALAFCRQSQQVLRPDLRILIMSATLDMDELAQLLQAPALHCTGKQYAVQPIYTGTLQQEDLPQRCAHTVQRALKESTGDLLVFLPGQAEINRCKELLDKSVPGVLIYALYGQLSMKEQQEAILPDAHRRRKVVLATSIAETSLTIEGVGTVVDCGFTRHQVFDAKTGLSRLQTVAITLDTATQRAGRAGRLGPGVCYRMWSLANEAQMEAFVKPEILKSDLLPLALDLLQWGASEGDSLTWLNPPPTGRLLQAQHSLHEMGAMDSGRITVHGKRMHRLPCHPRIAHMLLQAAKNNTLHLATDMAAMLEERDPLLASLSVDITLRIDALRRYRREGKGGQHFLKIAKTAAVYRNLFSIGERNESINPYDGGILLAHVFPERIAQAFAGNAGRFKMANGHMARLAETDDLVHAPWLAIAQIDARKGDGKVFLAAPLAQEQLEAIAQRGQVVSWDSRRGGLVAQEEWRIGALMVMKRPLHQVPGQDKVKAVIEAVKNEGGQLLSFDDTVVQWQNRVSSLRLWNPDDDWPAVDTETLLMQADDWLSPYLAEARKNEDLKRLPLKDILHQWLPYEQQQALDNLAPVKIQVPSGSYISIDYLPEGELPVLAVRLQEVFGLMETPKINRGKNALVLHLLSPGYKPVQVTTDLRSFWNGAYFEVRKELKRRYPKHSWPENPLDAEAVRGAVRKNRA